MDAAIAPGTIAMQDVPGRPYLADISKAKTRWGMPLCDESRRQGKIPFAVVVFLVFSRSRRRRPIMMIIKDYQFDNGLLDIV